VSGQFMPVLACRQAGRTLEQALSDLWRDIGGEGWLDVDRPRVIVQVGQRWRSTLVMETTRSLARLLANQFPAVEVDIFDCDTQVIYSQHPQDRDETAKPAVTVSGIAAREVQVPEWWFESFFLVTVTGAGPDPAGRISAVLDAQAEPLRRLVNPLPAASLAYEAHRLCASDLVVACVTATRDEPASEVWWFAGSCDVAVEMALIRASGCEPCRMPYTETIATHEVLPEFDMNDIAPRLRGYLAPTWKARLNAARESLAAFQRAALRDARTSWHSIPGIMRRRLASLKRRST
jgi:hypothetical protein